MESLPRPEQQPQPRKRVLPYHEMERYARQLLLEEWNQEKLASSTVLVAGIGALGSIVALDLVLTGVGKVIIVDFDTIEMSNLSRQLLFSERDIGKSKAIVAGKRLRAANPDVQVLALDCPIQQVRSSIWDEVDLIIDGLDTFEARRWLNSLCVHRRKTMIHGGMYGWWGNVQRVVPFETPCLECQPLIPAERLQKACTPPGQRPPAQVSLAPQRGHRNCRNSVSRGHQTPTGCGYTLRQLPILRWSPPALHNSEAGP